jgi:hypothetical protein
VVVMLGARSWSQQVMSRTTGFMGSARVAIVTTEPARHRANGEEEEEEEGEGEGEGEEEDEDEEEEEREGGREGESGKERGERAGRESEGEREREREKGVVDQHTAAGWGLTCRGTVVGVGWWA